MRGLATVFLSSCDTDLQQGRQLDFNASTLNGHGNRSTHCCTDTGASAKSFMDIKLAKRSKLSLPELIKPIKPRLANGQIVGMISPAVRAILSFEDDREELYCLITPLSKFDVIPDMPCMKLHDPQISFKERTCTFNSDHCMFECLKDRKPVIVRSPSADPTGKLSRSSTTKFGDIAEISAYAFTKLAERKGNQAIAMWPEDFERLDMGMDDGQQEPGYTADVAAISPEDYEKFDQKMKKVPFTREELKQKVPKDYYSGLDVWNWLEANKLPPHRSIDHTIKLQSVGMDV